jgi:small subunit ribosomal protein S2
LKENIAVREANRLGIPVFGMVDTNSDPTHIDFIIPCNDDATKSVELILGVICQAIQEGLLESKVERSNKEEAEMEVLPPRRERKSRARRTATAVSEGVKEELEDDDEDDS